MHKFPQEFNYKPYRVDTDIDYVTYNVSMKKNGTVFGILMDKGEQVPTPR